VVAPPSVRVVLSWTLAGGVFWGGMVVSVLTVAGLVAPGMQLLAAPVLFILGTVFGIAHGVAIAVIGRPDGVTRLTAFKRAGVGVLLSLPCVVIGWFVTAGITLTAALVADFQLPMFLLALLAWIYGAALCLWATMEAARNTRTALARWRKRRIGSALLAVIATILTIWFLQNPPTIAGSDLRFGGAGALILALELTLWMGLPVLFLVLRNSQEAP
jgi:hypothetical protein